MRDKLYGCCCGMLISHIADSVRGSLLFYLVIVHKALPLFKLNILSTLFIIFFRLFLGTILIPGRRIYIVYQNQEKSFCIRIVFNFSWDESYLAVNKECLKTSLDCYMTRLNNKNFLKTRLRIFAMYMIVNLIKLNLFLFICLFI